MACGSKPTKGGTLEGGQVKTQAAQDVFPPRRHHKLSQRGNRYISSIYLSVQGCYQVLEIMLEHKAKQITIFLLKTAGVGRLFV